VYIDLKKEIDLREISVGMMNLIVTACSAKPRSIRSQANMQKVSSILQIKVGTIFDMIRKLNQKSDVHLRTRGTHAAMACTDDGEANRWTLASVFFSVQGDSLVRWFRRQLGEVSQWLPR
jgi:formate dehydrogenase assembly factor FdhD